MKHLFCILLAAGIFLVPVFVFDVATAEDIQDSKDHPMLNRMPGYQISEYIVREFDAVEFPINDEDATNKVEGKKIEIFYDLSDGATPASEIQVVRNYVNALKNINGQVIHERSSLATVKVVKGGMETWVLIDVYNSGDNYTLTFVEKQGMQQAIVADASSMGQSIRSTGKVSLYGLYFDSGQAQIKPESEASLKEIAKLLKENPALKLYVVGHTDNVGSFDANMKLSQARSLSVVQELVTKYGIAAARLKGHGAASLAPVASNGTPEGKALNRRVELVEQ